MTSRVEVPGPDPRQTPPLGAAVQDQLVSFQGYALAAVGAGHGVVRWAYRFSHGWSPRGLAALALVAGSRGRRGQLPADVLQQLLSGLARHLIDGLAGAEDFELAERLGYVDVALLLSLVGVPLRL